MNVVTPNTMTNDDMTMTVNQNTRGRPTLNDADIQNLQKSKNLNSVAHKYYEEALLTPSMMKNPMEEADDGCITYHNQESIHTE